MKRGADLPCLPGVVSVFPLTGCILLPGNWLPLHIFEPRYRHLVSDALEGDRIIGMIQPLIPRDDNRAPVMSETRAPELYRVGGLGRIERCHPEPDGRFQILLRGMIRFRTLEELRGRRGYRRFRVACEEFEADLEEPAEGPDTRRLLDALEAFGERHGLPIDAGAFRKLPGSEMVNGLSASLPFPPEEKQALLEARDCRERERRLRMLLEMEIGGRSREGPPFPPTLH